MPRVIPLRRAEDPNLSGQKAAWLARLIRTGAAVPDGFVPPGIDIATTAFSAAVTEALSTLGDGPVAIRSSSTVEDLEAASFAGLYETILNVNGTADVIAGIERVRASRSAETVTSYFKNRMETVDAGAMAVLVQQMIPAESAGVVFTADPVTGYRSTTLVSAALGLGESLVSGQVTAEEWAVATDGTAVRRHGTESVIDEESAIRLAGIARRLEAEYGFPVDIEWAIHDGEVHILQLRPMTALPDPVSWEPESAGAWVRDFRLGEWLGSPVTPLFESWGLTRMEAVIDRTLSATLRMPPPAKSHIVLNGWYFYGFNFLPQSPREMLWQVIRYIIPSFLTQPRKAAMALPRLDSASRALRANRGKRHFPATSNWSTK